MNIGEIGIRGFAVISPVPAYLRLPAVCIAADDERHGVIVPHADLKLGPGWLPR